MKALLLVLVLVAAGCSTLRNVSCKDPRLTDPVGCAVCEVDGTPLPVVCPPPPASDAAPAAQPAQEG